MVNCSCVMGLTSEVSDILLLKDNEETFRVCECAFANAYLDFNDIFCTDLLAQNLV